MIGDKVSTKLGVEKRFVALSLGWGVQSFTLAAMSVLGELPMPDVAIHADTLYEFSGTYKFIEQWRWWLQSYGLNMVTVGLLESHNILNNRGGTKLPAFFIGPKGKGMAQRQCTGDWKIAPIRRWLQNNRHGRTVEMWLGISTDEALRMRDSNVKYITNRYPLIEFGMSRNDCRSWLKVHDLSIPPRSSCTFCPFHNTDEWRYIKDSPIDWAEAIWADRRIRKIHPPLELFVHPSRRPLEDVDFRTLEEMGQIRLWDEECSGVCGV